MRKVVALILAVALSLGIFSAALAESDEGSGSWPTITLNKIYSKLKDNEDEPKFRQQSFFGPGKEYHGAGAYRPSLTQVSAILRVGNYTLCELYSDFTGRRLVWFQCGMLTRFNVEKVELTRNPAQVTEEVQPMFGPGDNYGRVYETLPFGEKRDVKIAGGTEVNVFFEADGWVYVEFTDVSLGLITGWIPREKVQ